MNLGTVAYLPPTRIGHPELFLQNLADFPARNPIFFYSDQPWPNLSNKVPNPEQAKTTRNPWSFKNLIFLLGLQVAISHNLTYFIYLEEDSRVGSAGWDKIMFDEFLSQPTTVMAGSLICFNPFNSGPDIGRLFSELVANHNTDKNYPIATYLPVQSFGGKAIPDSATPCLFPMGSLAIYETAALQELFADCEMVSTARGMEPWDKEIGVRMWKRESEQVFEKIGVLRSSYSSYGNAATTEEKRKELLISGKIVAVHQIKSAWKPDVKTIKLPEEIKPYLRTIKDPLGQVPMGKIKRVKPNVFSCVWSPEKTEPASKLVVVLPFCDKDGELQFECVKWMGEMGQEPIYDCLLSCDLSVSKDLVAKIRKLSLKVFRQSFLLQYPAPPNDFWPHNANWLFQHTAICVQKYLGRPWLWKEPDMIPLKGDWIDQIQAEYQKAKQPFMGSFVPGMSHANGTAVFPENTPDICPQIINSLSSAFDTTIKLKMMPLCHNSIHLMQHVWGIKDGKPHAYLGEPIKFKTLDQVQEWVNPTAVTLHRVKNTSLIEKLRIMKGYL